MKKLPKIISQDEFEKVLKAEENKSIKLAMLLGFEAGMRISEIVGLREYVCPCHDQTIKRETIEDLTKKNKKRKILKCALSNLEVSHKNCKFSKTEWRIKPLTADRVEGVQIRIESGKGEKDGIVPRPKRMNEASLKLLPITISRRTLERHFRQLCIKVLGKPKNFHTSRHGFITHALNSGMQIHQVQLLARHSRMDTTGLYAHADPKQAIEGAREIF